MLLSFVWFQLTLVKWHDNQGEIVFLSFALLSNFNEFSFDIGNLLMHTHILRKFLSSVFDLALKDFIGEPRYYSINNNLHATGGIKPSYNQNVFII